MKAKLHSSVENLLPEESGPPKRAEPASGKADGKGTLSSELKAQLTPARKFTLELTVAPSCVASSQELLHLRRQRPSRGGGRGKGQKGATTVSHISAPAAADSSGAV